MSPRRYETVSKRWPIILTKLIDHIHRVNHELIMAATRPVTADDADADSSSVFRQTPREFATALRIL